MLIHPPFAPHGVGSFIEDHWFDPLNKANLPIKVKSLNSLSYCAMVHKAYPHPDNLLVYRNTAPHGLPNDTIPAGQAPAEAADTLWNAYVHDIDRTLRLDGNIGPEHLPIIWQEWLNEVDTHTQAAELAQVMLHLARKALADSRNLRVLLGGFNSGQPEPEHWPLFNSVLQLCVQFPTRLGISLHEYKLGENWQTRPITDFIPHHYGRYRELLRYCKQEFGRLPTVVISEAGWAYDLMPAQDKALEELDYLWRNLYGHDHQAVKGVFLWNLDNTGFPLAGQMVNFLKPLSTYVRDNTMQVPDNGEQPPPPANITRTAHLLPQNTTLQELQAVTQHLHPQRTTFTHSADDAAIIAAAGDNKSKVVVWEPGRWTDPIGPWLEARGVPNVEQRSFGSLIPDPPPDAKPTGPARLGLHAPADPDIPPAVLEEFRELRPGLIKVLTINDKPGIARLAAQHPHAHFIVRPFVSFIGPGGSVRNISPQQFFNDTINDMVQCLDATKGHKTYLELHNEPNLRAEGLGGPWFDGGSFAQWLLAVAGLFRNRFPSVPLLFPGCSPGVEIHSGTHVIRMAQEPFLRGAQAAIDKLDGLCLHLYWSQAAPAYMALQTLDKLLKAHPGVPVWITEASHNKPGISFADKGKQYWHFYQELKRRPRVQGVTYFVAAASNQEFASEVWTGNGVAAAVTKERQKSPA